MSVKGTDPSTDSYSIGLATEEALSLARMQQVDNMNPFTVRFGNDRKEVVETFSPGWRTPAQFKAIKRIVADPNFDFSSGPSPIFANQGGRGRYEGDYAFTYWTKDGIMHTTTVYSDGSIVDFFVQPKKPEV